MEVFAVIHHQRDREHADIEPILDSVFGKDLALGHYSLPDGAHRAERQRTADHELERAHPAAGGDYHDRDPDLGHDKPAEVAVLILELDRDLYRQQAVVDFPAAL